MEAMQIKFWITQKFETDSYAFEKHTSRDFFNIFIALISKN